MEIIFISHITHDLTFVGVVETPLDSSKVLRNDLKKLSFDNTSKKKAPVRFRAPAHAVNM